MSPFRPVSVLGPSPPSTRRLPGSYFQFHLRFDSTPALPLVVPPQWVVHLHPDTVLPVSTGSDRVRWCGLRLL